MNPEHLFSSGVVSVADRAPRTDQQPAPPSGPNPVGSHPVSRGGRAPFDRGNLWDWGRWGRSSSAHRRPAGYRSNEPCGPRALRWAAGGRWPGGANAAALPPRRWGVGLRNQAWCAIKVPEVAGGVRRLAGGMARAYRYQGGPNLSSLAARPAERFAYN